MKWTGRGLLFGTGMLVAFVIKDTAMLRKLASALDHWADINQDLDDERDERLGKILAREMKADVN